MMISLLVPAFAGCQSVRTVGTENRPVLVETVDNETEISAEEAEILTTVSFQQESQKVESAIPTDSEPDSLTLADFERLAFEYNPTLTSAMAAVDGAYGQRVQAGLYPNTVVGYHATEVGNLGTAGQQGGFISQKFITGGKLDLDQFIASRQIQEADHLLDAQQLRVLSDVRVRFYDALVAQRRLELTFELAEIGDELSDASNKLLAARQVSENNLLQAEIEAEQAHILHDNAENEKTEAWRRLWSVVGVPEREFVAIEGDLEQNLPDYTWEECYAMVLGQSSEMAAAKMKVERAKLSIDRADRENIPDIDLMVSVRHHNITESELANIQVGFPIPILNQNQGNIMRAQSELVAAKSDVRRIELDLQDRLALAYRRYADAKQQTSRYNDSILGKARKSLDLVKDGYEEGQSDYLSLITAQQTFVRVNLAYLESLKELRTSLVIIEGQLLTGSLSR